MDNSRTQKSIVNVSAVIAMQAITALVNLISRTFFIKLLGNDYLSVNGLFTNILTLLSFTELGIGNAIIYSLYKPLAENDEIKVCEILMLLKKAYRIIAITILCLGICVIPFLDVIIKDVPDISESLTILYLLFLGNTVSSYLFSYKKSLLIADQKNYVVVIVQHIVHIIQAAIQIVFLYFTHNYIIYLCICIFATLTTNIICTLFVNQKYKYIAKYQKAKLSIVEKKNIFENIKAIFVYKLGAVLLNGTDNIIISVVLKTAYVGICSNYTLVINTINNVLMQACNSIAGGIGNHIVIADSNAKEKKFRELNILCFAVFSFSAVCLAVLLNPLILVWLGNDYILERRVVIALVLAFYLTGVNQINSMYRTSMGLFSQAKFVPATAAFINIGMSILLGRYWGLFGVFIATSISKILTFSIIDPILLYRKGFNMSVKKYFIRFFMECAVTVLIYLITQFAISMINTDGYAGLILKTCVCISVSFLLLVGTLFFNQDFKYVIKIVLNIIKKFFMKNFKR